MMISKNIEDAEEYLNHPENRKQELHNQINDNWLMKTPERVDNLPSPPYVTINKKMKMIIKLKSPHTSSHLLPP